MAKSTSRLDTLLVDRGLAPTRARAQALILAGKVLVEGRPGAKAGQTVPAGAAIEVTGDAIPYVSRGGVKLEHAINHFGIDVRGRVAMDVGASTGGFTDCLLSFGAARVYAVDTGYGQLDLKLRNDPRVVVIERQNIRYLPRELVPEPIRIATADTSFISLKIVIPAMLPFLADEATVIALIKPQFEAGRAQVGKGGVVRDPEVHRLVCESIAEFFGARGLRVAGITPSPLLGPKGNREFLIAALYPGNREAQG